MTMVINLGNKEGIKRECALERINPEIKDTNFN